MSDVEDLKAEGGVNALQTGDMCYFCKKTGHQKRDCMKFEEWMRKNPHKKPRGNYRSATSLPAISCYNCGKEGHIALECRGETKEGEITAEMGGGGYRWRRWSKPWQ